MAARPYVGSGFDQAVQAERVYQDAKWGPQRHEWSQWLIVLTEEIGEAAQAAIQLTWHRSALGSTEEFDQLLALRSELIQAAAVIAHMVEQLDEEIAAGQPGNGTVS